MTAKLVRPARLGLGRRLVLQVALAVAVAIVAAGAATFLIVRAQLRESLDESLRERAAAARVVVVDRRSGGVAGRPAGGGVMAPGQSAGAPEHRKLPPLQGEAFATIPGGPGPRKALTLPPPTLGGPDFLIQVVDRTGRSRAVGGPERALPVSAADLEVARGKREEALDTRDVRGTSLRVLSTRISPGVALQVARPTDEADDAIAGLLRVLLAIAAAGTALAVLIGIGISRRSLRPIRELTAAAEEIARARDLTRRIEGAAGGDEVGRLRANFNRMLADLQRSVEAQRSLVADASHELRTPLTSLRANVELLDRWPGLDGAERERLQADVEAELLELGRLVDDLVEVAREGTDGEAAQRDLRLDELAADAVARARRRYPERRFEVALRPLLLNGDGERLERAISNLLDNAARWSLPGSVIEVWVGDSELRVRDHGPGIAERDLPHVFDRFYRAEEARGRSGSGLGLAIVRRVAEQHGATAEAARAEGGGTVVTLRFPEP